MSSPSEAPNQRTESRDDTNRRDRAPRVCHIVATTEGATWMVEQLRGLRDQHGCDVTAVVSGTSGSLIDKLDSEGIPHFALNFSLVLRRIFGVPFEVFRLARFFRQHRFDVVQTHVFRSMLFARPAAWLADVPVRLSMISGPFHLEAPATRRIDRSTHWMETMLIPSCDASFRMCREMGVPKERLTLIYYGVDERKFDPRHTKPADVRRRFGWKENEPVIGMVAYFYGRLPRNRWVPPYLADRAGKGHEELINAAPIVQGEFPAAKFLLVGPGWGQAGEAYLQELKELVHRLGLHESIVFTGYHEEVADVLRDLDVAVQASLSENLGGTIEGLLMARPMVATRVGGMPDAVRDGETGILVNPSDPEDLARGIIQQLRDPEKARAMGAAGRKLMLERFTLRRTVDDLSELYHRLLKREGNAQQKYRPTVSCYRLLMLSLGGSFVALWFLPQVYIRARRDKRRNLNEGARAEKANTSCG
jgi:glycosyltransferase involved in cell wall biosynthesis